MAKKKRKKSTSRRTSGDPRRAAEQRREEHARLVRERDGDMRYVQATRTATGRQYSWDPESEVGSEITDLFGRRRDAFIEKFGREPGPEDPIFFDPEANEPQPLPDDGFDFDLVSEAFEAAGLDPAYAQAYRELGCIVTEMNRHTFTAHEVEAWDEAVERHMNDEA
ncbi:MAG: hypothetical protein ACTHW4_07625 [Actinomycetales bacterium]